MLDHTGCRAVVVAGHYLDEIDAVRDRLPNLEHVIVRGDDYESWLAGFSADDPNVEISPTIGTSFATLVERPGSQKVLPIATGRGLLLDATGSTTFRRWRLATGACMWAYFSRVGLSLHSDVVEWWHQRDARPF